MGHPQTPQGQTPLSVEEGGGASVLTVLTRLLYKAQGRGDIVNITLVPNTVRYHAKNCLQIDINDVLVLGANKSK